MASSRLSPKSPLAVSGTTAVRSHRHRAHSRLSRADQKLDETTIEVAPDVADPAAEGQMAAARTLRNHRKILVVDGRSAFVGSLNMIDASYHNPKHERAGRKWRELVMQIDGPAVFSLDIVFATDWFLETNGRCATMSSNTRTRRSRRCALPGRAQWTRLPR